MAERSCLKIAQFATIVIVLVVLFFASGDARPRYKLAPYSSSNGQWPSRYRGHNSRGVSSLQFGSLRLRRVADEFDDEEDSGSSSGSGSGSGSGDDVTVSSSPVTIHVTVTSDDEDDDGSATGSGHDWTATTRALVNEITSSEETSRLPISEETNTPTISGETDAPSISEETSSTASEETNTTTISEETNSTASEETNTPATSEETNSTISEETDTPPISEETNSTISEETNTPATSEETNSTISEETNTPTISEETGSTTSDETGTTIHTELVYTKSVPCDVDDEDCSASGSASGTGRPTDDLVKGKTTRTFRVTCDDEDDDEESASGSASESGVSREDFVKVTTSFLITETNKEENSPHTDVINHIDTVTVFETNYDGITVDRTSESGRSSDEDLVKETTRLIVTGKSSEESFPHTDVISHHVTVTEQTEDFVIVDKSVESGKSAEEDSVKVSSGPTTNINSEEAIEHTVLSEPMTKVDPLVEEGKLPDIALPVVNAEAKEKSVDQNLLVAGIAGGCFLLVIMIAVIIVAVVRRKRSTAVVSISKAKSSGVENEYQLKFNSMSSTKHNYY